MFPETFPVLQNETVLLKKMELRDLPSLREMMQQEAVYRYEPSFLPELLSENPPALITRDCDRLLREQSCILLGIYPQEEPERFLGICELYGYSAERSKISIGYRLKQEEWRKGYASNTVALLKKYILEEWKLKRITAHVMTDNPASAACLLKNGFVQRRGIHEEDWGRDQPVLALKYVIYPEEAK